MNQMQADEIEKAKEEVTRAKRSNQDPAFHQARLQALYKKPKLIKKNPRIIIA